MAAGIRKAVPLFFNRCFSPRWRIYMARRERRITVTQVIHFEFKHWKAVAVVVGIRKRIQLQSLLCFIGASHTAGKDRGVVTKSNHF